MDIVIISDFAGDFSETSNGRFVYLAKMLINNGHSVEIITSNFNHRTKKHFEIINHYKGISITMLDEKYYHKNVCIKRFISHYKWGKLVGKYLKKRKKPDVIYCAIPPLKVASIAGKYCCKNNVKFIIDVQDLWPEAYRMVFNIPLISSLIYFPFKLIADSAYKRADVVIAVSQTYVDRALLVNKKIDKGYPIYLGTSLKAFDTYIKEDVNIKKESNEIWVGYCGTLGASYDLKIVFDAIKEYNNPNLKFVIIGSGPSEEEFKEYSQGLNVLFVGYVPYPKMCSILKKCDIVVNPIKYNAAQSIINKHADYAAVGLPVLNTQDSMEYKDLVDNYNMGFNIMNHDFKDLANKLKFLVENEKIRHEMGQNSRKCAEDLFNRDSTYLKIVDLIENKM